MALITQYNTSVTKDETQKQFLLQGVEDNRRVIKRATKKSLVAGLKAYEL
jgi:hypothetical protein